MGPIIAGIHCERAERALEGLLEPFVMINGSPAKQSFLSSVSGPSSSLLSSASGGWKKKSSLLEQCQTCQLPLLDETRHCASVLDKEGTQEPTPGASLLSHEKDGQELLLQLL